MRGLSPLARWARAGVIAAPALAIAALVVPEAQAQAGKPNILVIFGDDVDGAMDEVFQFAATFKEFPPRSFPPSFVPSTIMEQTLDQIKDERR